MFGGTARIWGKKIDLEGFSNIRLCGRKLQLLKNKFFLCHITQRKDNFYRLKELTKEEKKSLDVTKSFVPTKVAFRIFMCTCVDIT